MSNHRAVFSSMIVTALVAASGARAQSPALIEAVRTSQTGVVELARAELEACLTQRCARAGSLRLLTGVLLLSGGEPGAAATLLAAGKAPPGLEPLRRWYQGEAEAWSGQRRRALRTLEGASPGAPAWLRQRLERRRAELQLDLGLAAQARPVLERLAESEPGPESLLERGLARLATSDSAQALRDFRTLALRYPRHPHAALAIARLEAAGPLRWSPEEVVQRAQASLAAGDPAAALASLAGIPELTPRGLLVKGQALLQLRRDEEGLEALEAAATGAEPAAGAEARLTLARRLLRLDRPLEARRAFQQVETAWPEEPGSDEAGYLAAWLAMNLGRLDQAAEELAGFERQHPDSRRRDEARWFRALCLIRLERAGEAGPVLEALAEDFPRSPLVPQARYWSARLRQLAGDAGVGEVAPAYRAVVAAFPGSLAARLALEQLRGLGEPAPEPFPRLDDPAPARLPPELGLTRALLEVGLLRDAQTELEAVVSRVTSPGEALRIGAGLQGLGEYGAAYGLAGRHLWAAAYTARDPRALALLYPRAWRPSVERWSQAHGVEAALAWAIMRRESSFHPEATSAADARGLMQVLPSTARQVARDARFQVPEPEELHGPDASVRFGTWYLGRLARRLEHPALVAAAYNAGPTPVLRWLQQRGDEPLDRWIEEIPFKETRAYVKQVVADQFTYQALYGDAVSRLPLALPRPAGAGVDY